MPRLRLAPSAAGRVKVAFSIGGGYRPVYVPELYDELHPPTKAEVFCNTSVGDLLFSFRSRRLGFLEYLQFLKARRRQHKNGRKKGASVMGFEATPDPCEISHKLRDFAKTNQINLFKAKSLLPLAGLVFDTKQAASNHVTLKALADQFESLGARSWGVTKAPIPPSIPVTFGLTNPYHKDLFVGGSSGGAAYSVACGLSSFSLGTNAGGSNRIPAGLLGLTGLYMGSGIRLPNTSGVKSLHRSAGFICRTPDDAGILLSHLLRHGSQQQEAIVKNFQARLSDDTIGRIAVARDLVPPHDDKEYNKYLYPGTEKKFRTCVCLHL